MRPLGEADRILTLFSRERGKLEAVAKGARRTRSKFGARLDFFARSAIGLHSGRSLDIVTSATTIAGAWSLVVDPDTYSFLSYIAEVIDALCEPALAVPELYDVLCELQGAVAGGAGSTALAAAVDLRLLSALGLAPELDGCARCGAALGRRPLAGGRARLSPHAGGLLCSRCAEKVAGAALERGDLRDAIGISGADLRALRGLRSLPLPQGPPTLQSARLATVTHAFIQYQLGRRSKALSVRASAAK